MQGTARHLHANLRLLEAKGTDPLRTADAAAAMWREIDAALSPVIGQRGVIALYRRSILLCRVDYPWLITADDAGDQDEFATLHATLWGQSSSDAAAAHGVLVQTFYELLRKLIGATLTERLLQSVPDNPSSGSAAQDSPT